MGQVYAEIELINGDDLSLIRHSLIDKDEVRRIWVTALVDTGTVTLAINENIREQLQLPLLEKKRYRLANEHVVEYDIVGPVEIKFKNRNFLGSAIVLPGDSEPLLGLLPLEGMDVLIDPLREELIVNPAHPDGAVLRL